MPTEPKFEAQNTPASVLGPVRSPTCDAGYPMPTAESPTWKDTSRAWYDSGVHVPLHMRKIGF
jgi:hypothetical protein